MSLYYNNFKYLDKNSTDQGLIVASFEPDDGFTESFLSMEPIQEDYYDGTKSFDYGAKYNAKAIINITVIKNDGSDFSLANVRSLSKWLTGSRINSWLDVGPSKDDIKYSFLGRVTNLQPRKMDGRTTGYLIEFTSVSPWAFSQPQMFDCYIWQLIKVIENGTLINGRKDMDYFGVTKEGNLDGILTPSIDSGSYFKFSDDGVVYLDNKFRTKINNESDDLYTYIYLDIDYKNENGTYISIKNETLDEETLIKNVSENELIKINSKQFIISDIPYKLFGEDFNFVWPRLQPGLNEFIIDGDGRGSAQFTYRYPMKVGDCAMDISVYGGNCGCGEMVSYETVKWENIIGTPTSISGYGITDAYTMDEIDNKLNNIKVDNIEWSDIANTPTTIEGYGITDTYTTGDVYTKTEVDDKIEEIEITGGSGSSNVNIDEEELNNMLDDILK